MHECEMFSKLHMAETVTVGDSCLRRWPVVAIMDKVEGLGNIKAHTHTHLVYVEGDKK